MKALLRTTLLLTAFGGVLHADAPAPTVSVADMSAKAAAIRGAIVEDAQKIVTFREQARKLKDVIKLNCVNDKQIQAKAEMNIADLANDSLQSASDRSADERQAAFTQLSSAGEAIRRLREEAGACVGEQELFKQEQGGMVEAPEITDDPTQGNPFGGGEIEPPLSASK
jgi:hypothetical protein